MKKQTLAIFLVLMVVGIFTISASAQNTHSVWTNNNGLAVVDPNVSCNYTAFSGFNMATSWTEPTPPNYPEEAHFRGVTKAGGTGCTTYFYDFRLNKSVQTTVDDITGYWDIYRNGVLMCSACKGIAYGLSQAAGVGNYYKVYIDDPVFGPSAWLYSGYIDNRKDF
jgi:hypothetical protein